MAFSYIIFFTTLFLYYVDNSVQWGKSDCEPGPQGEKGYKGIQGLPGKRGDGELIEFTNWRQCAWHSANGNDYDTIYDCTFTKQHSDTSLWVYYGGNLRITGCHACCKRWYFTFNNAECSPVPIDGVVYQENTNNINLYRHRSIQGYCHNIGSGEIHVRFHVGDCSGYGNADAYTGWESASRILIKEVYQSPY